MSKHHNYLLQIAGNKIDCQQKTAAPVEQTRFSDIFHFFYSSLLILIRSFPYLCPHRLLIPPSFPAVIASPPSCSSKSLSFLLYFLPSSSSFHLLFPPLISLAALTGEPMAAAIFTWSFPGFISKNCSPVLFSARGWVFPKLIKTLLRVFILHTYTGSRPVSLRLNTQLVHLSVSLWNCPDWRILHDWFYVTLQLTFISSASATNRVWSIMFFLTIVCMLYGLYFEMHVHVT